MRRAILLAGLSTLVMPLGAIADDSHATVQPDALKWSTPAVYAPGAQVAVVKGDPSKEGTYIVRLKVPAGFKIAPHVHPNDENVTVLSGSFNIGTGDKADQGKGTLVNPAAIRLSPRACRTTPGSPKRPFCSCMERARRA
jgi:hypothetical protein